MSHSVQCRRGRSEEDADSTCSTVIVRWDDSFLDGFIHLGQKTKQKKNANCIVSPSLAFLNKQQPICFRDSIK